MKVLHWLDRNFELLILAIMLAVMCVLSFANVVHALWIPPCLDLVR